MHLCKQGDGGNESRVLGTGRKYAWALWILYDVKRFADRFGEQPSWGPPIGDSGFWLKIRSKILNVSHQRSVNDSSCFYHISRVSHCCFHFNLFVKIKKWDNLSLFITSSFPVIKSYSLLGLGISMQPHFYVHTIYLILWRLFPFITRFGLQEINEQNGALN